MRARHAAAMVEVFGSVPAEGRLGAGGVIAPWQQAEELAAEMLRACGFSDAAVTAAGSDGGLDVVGRGVIAQVKYLGHRAGSADLQRLAGANVGGAQAVFFSLAGFSQQAVRYADAVRMALFTVELPDTVLPVNAAARELAAG
jgi:hypothetical protein